MQASVLDNIYFQARFSELLNCVDLFLAQTPAYELTDADTIADIIKSVRDGNETVNRQLFDIYCRNLRKAVDSVRNRDELAGLLRANISQFAAYKAYQVTRQIRSANDDDEARATINRFNRYQAAEYNTTISRCRTAKQFDKFTDDERRRLFPNLRWLPSRSATPRPEHQEFWHKVWPKDDPFWSTNQPGCLWNCKCDWEETDDDATAGNPTNDDNAPGIGLNPATTGEVFNTPEACRKFNDANGRTEKNEVLPHPYFKGGESVQKSVKEFYRNDIRNQHNGYKHTIKSEMGPILIDEITMIEVSKGAASESSYFLKQEIVQNFERYVNKLERKAKEDVDLSHNNPKSIFSRRKRKFSCFHVFSLTVNKNTYTVKMGEYKQTKFLNLYSITE